jgi:hypothetical protein
MPKNAESNPAARSGTAKSRAIRRIANC